MNHFHTGQTSTSTYWHRTSPHRSPAPQDGFVHHVDGEFKNDSSWSLWRFIRFHPCGVTLLPAWNLVIKCNSEVQRYEGSDGRSEDVGTRIHDEAETRFPAHKINHFTVWTDAVTSVRDILVQKTVNLDRHDGIKQRSDEPSCPMFYRLMWSYLLQPNKQKPNISSVWMKRPLLASGRTWFNGNTTSGVMAV